MLTAHLPTRTQKNIQRQTSHQTIHAWWGGWDFKETPLTDKKKMVKEKTQRSSKVFQLVQKEFACPNWFKNSSFNSILFIHILVTSSSVCSRHLASGLQVSINFISSRCVKERWLFFVLSCWKSWRVTYWGYVWKVSQLFTIYLQII